MGAYPFQPMSKESLKKLPNLNRIIKDNTDSNCLKKDSVLLDNTTLETKHPQLDQNCNHPQTDSP
jgi:hypothetical protein